MSDVVGVTPTPDQQEFGRCPAMFVVNKGGVYKTGVFNESLVSVQFFFCGDKKGCLLTTVWDMSSHICRDKNTCILNESLVHVQPCL